MKRLMTAAAAALIAATPALADFEERRSTDDVATVMDRLEAAVNTAGATVFARVNHGAGAVSVDMELVDAELLVFGNPMLGTPALQDDIRAGLMLPLRVLVYADGEGSVITWETPEGMFDGLEIAAEAPYLERMNGALNNLTAAAAGE
ncbi:DUF302 domain-containing protein [Jannaschia sp. CCS1]|uniref:DUF302 domain-containing protein n=1 Tax=Jannaschia sp. (strain CCS1) TaxID=290400 RepID=UPI000053B2A1|nr:DUF302 domain-containing protein [Jannaschia sp. CCS1]ABD55711.1 protein of unknown function DUF302 [Jannaschia sp. CCS1]